MNATQPRNIMPAVGAVILVVIVGYYLFLAADTQGLEERHGNAVVLEKIHRAARSSYTTQVINNRPRAVPQELPETFLLQLEVEGQKAEAPVSAAQFDALAAGQQIGVTYQLRRLTGILQISEVESAKR